VRNQLPDSLLAEAIADVAHSEFINRDDVRNRLAQLARHPDPDVRSEVIRAFAFHGVVFNWNAEPGKTLLSDIMTMATQDVDADCRRAAATGLGSLMRGTRDKSIAALLAGIVANRDEESEVRSFAYAAFLDLLGVPVKEQPNPLRLQIGNNELSQLERHLRSLQGNARR
jgi:hypothetical protein